jgi:hypothetical protein
LRFRTSVSAVFIFGEIAFAKIGIAGPSIGGIVYAFGDSEWVYGSAAGLLLISLLMLLFIKSRPLVIVRDAVSMGSMLEGLRFVWRRKTVLGAISLDLFAVLFGGATALLPAFTRDFLHAGALSALGLGLSQFLGFKAQGAVDTAKDTNCIMLMLVPSSV